MRVLSDAPSLAATLKERFALKYPIFTRRLQYFSFKQSQGQSYSDFRSKLSELRKQADLESLSADQLEVFRIVCAISNRDLKENILKLDDPSLEDVEKTASLFESTQANLRACQCPQNRAQAAVVKAANLKLGSLDNLCKKCGN